MSATYIIVKGETREEAEAKAKAMIKEIDYMRQPSIYSSHEGKNGGWEVIVQQWGLD